MGDNSTDWVDYLLQATPSSDLGMLFSKINDLNSGIPKEVEAKKSLEQLAELKSSPIECITNAPRENRSQVEVATPMENNMQDSGLLQQMSKRGRRKRTNATPEEKARRAEEKKIKNRVSAARSREKRNEHISNLESKLKQLQRENEILERKVNFQVEMKKGDEKKTKAETKAKKATGTLNKLRRTFSSPF